MARVIGTFTTGIIDENIDECCFGRAYIMIVVFNLALFALVLLSFVMIVGVPVAYAAPQNWDRSKQLLFVGSGAWTILVVVVGVLNFLVV